LSRGFCLQLRGHNKLIRLQSIRYLIQGSMT